ncbi:MAG: class I SAM-dependent methyltransferase [Campylobacterota bacterium]|nr:class I SAM-dependent methyltransferase [Campylobacterota bacterium]
MNLDLYANVEDMLGLEEATHELHVEFYNELEKYNFKTLLDVGCGRGEFIKNIPFKDVTCSGIDKSQVMVDACKKSALHVECKDVSEVKEKYDVVVSIFDVLNFMNKKELQQFLQNISNILNEDGIFIADINSLYGFESVADGTYIAQDESRFLSVEGEFNGSELTSTFTLFTAQESGLHVKQQDKIVQTYHTIKEIKKSKSLRLINQHNISLYDSDDKIMLVFKRLL